MKTLALWVVGGFLAVVLVTGMLPMFESAATNFFTSATSTVLDVLPKAAVLTCALGIGLTFTKKTHPHGLHMLKWGILGVAASAVLAGALTWLGTESSHVAPSVFTLADGAASRVVAGLTAGIG